MRQQIYTILAAFIFCVGCADRQYLIDKPENFGQFINEYKSCKTELLENKLLFPSTTIKYVDLKSILTETPENKLPVLRRLIKDDLINKDKVAIEFDRSGKLIDFYFKSVESGFLTKLLSNRKMYTDYIISFDPNKSWMERKSAIGVTNDVGINELIEVEKDWYFVQYWTAEE